MIQKFVDKFLRDKKDLIKQLKKEHPSDYATLVKMVITLITSEDEYFDPDPDRITAINYSDYQGTILFVIACKGYQPSTFWAVCVNYGSCSGCDTLQAIAEDTDDYQYDKPPNQRQVDQYMTLSLHIVQSIRPIIDGYENQNT